MIRNDPIVEYNRNKLILSWIKNGLIRHSPFVNEIWILFFALTYTCIIVKEMYYCQTIFDASIRAFLSW